MRVFGIVGECCDGQRTNRKRFGWVWCAFPPLVIVFLSLVPSINCSKNWFSQFRVRFRYFWLIGLGILLCYGFLILALFLRWPNESHSFHIIFCLSNGILAAESAFKGSSSEDGELCRWSGFLSKFSRLHHTPSYRATNYYFFWQLCWLSHLDSSRCTIARWNTVWLVGKCSDSTGQVPLAGHWSKSAFCLPQWQSSPLNSTPTIRIFKSIFWNKKNDFSHWKIKVNFSVASYAIQLERPNWTRLSSVLFGSSFSTYVPSCWWSKTVPKCWASVAGSWWFWGTRGKYASTTSCFSSKIIIGGSFSSFAQRYKMRHFSWFFLTINHVMKYF